MTEKTKLFSQLYSGSFETFQRRNVAKKFLKNLNKSEKKVYFFKTVSEPSDIPDFLNL